ncbi:hypothetical protein [Hansschlegelia plantiphila]|uniref:Uncharacterized protein n=1 Tax=Hansschlegelia plantiphila TaxID=374655 RepID=A0A9W6MU73_9HYPH|nr:hypothetical protein [Hansschlegelia plantiphila]GLK66657.1 hypothetical protein GCM10008179_02950 [Hansschlegelia plantiphila]
MAEPDNLVLTLLRELRSVMDSRFDAVNTRFDAVDARFAEQDRKLEAIREALKSETILGRYVVNGVDDRLDAIEARS